MTFRIPHALPARLGPINAALLVATGVSMLAGCLVLEKERGPRNGGGDDGASEGANPETTGTPDTESTPLPRIAGDGSARWDKEAFQDVLENTPQLAGSGATRECTFPNGLGRLVEDGASGSVTGCKVLAIAGTVEKNQVATFEGVERLYVGTLEVDGDLAIKPAPGTTLDVVRLENWGTGVASATFSVTGGIDLSDMRFSGSNWIALRDDDQGRLPRARLARLAFRNGQDNHPAVTVDSFGNANAAKDFYVSPTLTIEDVTMVDYQRPLSLGAAIGLSGFTFQTSPGAALKRQPAIILAGATHYLPKSAFAEAAFPYLVLGSQKVAAGAELTLAAGAQFKADKDVEIKVEKDGVLLISGTESAPVVLTALNDATIGGDTAGTRGDTKPKTGDWGGILLSGFEEASAPRAVIRNAEMRFAGIESSWSKFQVTDSKIREAKQCINNLCGSIVTFSTWQGSIGNVEFIDSPGSLIAMDRNEKNHDLSDIKASGTSVGRCWISSNDNVNDSNKASYFPSSPLAQSFTFTHGCGKPVL